MSDFATYFAAAQQHFKSAFGEAVTWARGSDSATLTAVPATGEMEVDTGNGILEVAYITTFDIVAADLTVDGAEVRPQRGDTITTSGGITYRAEGEIEVYNDGTVGAWYRVHTRRVN